MATNSAINLKTAASGKLVQAQGIGTACDFTTATYPSTVTQGDVIYASASNTITSLAKNTTATRYLSNTGTSNNPAWAQVNVANGVTGTLPIANGGTNATSMATSSGIVKYDGTSLVTSSAATLNASNVYNNTAQPSVKAVLTTTASNITGDGTVVTIPFDTVTTNSGFDQASNYNTSTYRFTAPVAGRYLVHCTAYLAGVAAGHNSGTIFILGNNTNNIGQYIFNPGAIRDVNNTCSIAFTQMLTFAANDYIEMRLVVYSGAKTISVGSDNFGLLSWFNIQLVN